MTRYYVDGREVEVPSNFSSFDQMLKHVEDRYLESSAIIREVHVDGSPLAPESFRGGDGILDRVGDWEKIEIFTGTLAEIAVESIAGAQDYLIKIANAAPALAVKFQDFPESEDFGNLGSLCEGFYFLSILLDKLASGYQLKLDEIIVHGVSVSEHLQKFADVVKQLNEAQEKQEYLLIADTIEYEILPIVPVWKEIFEAVSVKIAAVH
ncbi:MAG: hypothetical protein FWF13_00760 [Acidobacteria bacterium]|nr:hypothetical protein [Acidobacteriota bacterium]